MTQPQVLEGTWEEILTRNAAQLAGRKIRVYIEPEEEADTTAFPSNEKALAALRQIARMQLGMRDTDGSQTERIIQEGRDGGMYHDSPPK